MDVFPKDHFEAEMANVSFKRVGGQYVVRKIRKRGFVYDGRDFSAGAIEREAEILPLMWNLSFVPNLIGHGTRWGDPYLDQEPIYGLNFKKAIYQIGFTLDDLEGLKDGAIRLSKIHGRGVVHRDLNFKNIILRDGKIDDICFIDFGVAVDMRDIKPEEHRLRFGSPPITAPEQLEGKFDERSDVFAWGSVIYCALCGAKPYDFVVPTFFGVSFGGLYRPNMELSEKNPKIPYCVNDVVMKAVAEKPEDRFQNMEEFAGELERLCSTL